jgi:hypothetical protein
MRAIGLNPDKGENIRHNSLILFYQNLVMSEQHTVPQQSTEKISLQDFLKSSVSNAVHRVQDGVSYIKNELYEMYSQSGYYLDQMALPVNNFLKDFSQIDTELSQESKQSGHFLTLDGQMVPVEQVLNRPMEENY